MRYLIIGILLIADLSDCRQAADKTVKKDNTVVKNSLPAPIKKDTVIKKVYPLTDSGQLMRHLDSLPKTTFPYVSDGQDPNSRAIDLSIFKNKKLFHIPFKRIPIELGGSALDEHDHQDSTFNLVDSVNYKANWAVVAATPKFVVIDDWEWGVLVTLSYNFDVIDAIHTAAGEGNSHWQIERKTTIYKNLTMLLHHTWDVQTDDKGNFDHEDEDQDWFIDNDGHILMQPARHKHKRHR